MQIFDYDRTVAALPYTDLARSIAEVLHMKVAGAATAPERMHMPLPGGGLLLCMPACDPSVTVTKLVTVHPDNNLPENSARQLPTIQGEVVVMETATGRRIALLDGIAVTQRRTAALSLLAAQALAPDPGPLLVVGAGAQARAHVDAFREGLGVREVHVLSRTAESAEALVQYAQRAGLEAYVARNVRTIVERTPLIVTATTSLEPVLPKRLPSDCFVAAVGAHTPDMAELPAGLLRDASVYVDTLEALNEAGDLIRAGLGPQDVVPLEEMLDGKRPERGPVVFKSTGHALFDLAAARSACKIAEDGGRNLKI